MNLPLFPCECNIRQVPHKLVIAVPLQLTPESEVFDVPRSEFAPVHGRHRGHTTLQTKQVWISTFLNKRIPLFLPKCDIHIY